MNSGGWIEHLEFEIDAQCDDNSVPPDSKVKELCTYTNQMGLASGRDLHVSRSMKQMIEEAGFVEVREEKIKLPIGSWATDPKMKDVGRFFERYYKTGLQGWLLQICTRTMGVSRQISEQRLRLLTHEISGLWARSMMHAYKPFAKSTAANNIYIILCESML